MIQSETAISAGVTGAGDETIKSAVAKVVDPQKYDVPIYYGGLTEDGKYVLAYDLIIVNGDVIGKTWKSKSVLNWKNFLRMMIGSVSTLPGHLSHHRSTAPLIPLTKVNPDWVAFSHEEIMTHEKLLEAVNSDRERVQTEYAKAKAIFEGTAEEPKKIGRKSVDPGADPLERMTKAKLAKFISGLVPADDMPSMEKTKKQELVQLAKAVREKAGKAPDFPELSFLVGKLTGEAGDAQPSA